MASERRRLTRNWRVAVRHVATRRFIDVLGVGSLGLSMQASEGWADLPATTRPQQRVQPEAAGDRVATDSDRQSGRAGTGWRAEWRVQLCALFPVHLLATWTVAASRTQPSSGPSMRRPVGPLGIPGACSLAC
jgi:hypothetical protein